MLYEYAVDPRVIVDIAMDRRDFCLFLRSFEIGNPRVISNFPKFSKLKKEIERCAQEQGVTGTDSTRLDELLSFLRLLPKVSRPRDSAGTTWAEKICSEASRAAFDTIFVSGIETVDVRPQVRLDDCYLGSCEYWDFEDRVVVQKTAESMAGALGNMLRLASKVYIIDPYMGTHSDKWSPFIAFLNKAISNRVSDQLEVTVYHAPSKGVSTPGEMKRHFERQPLERDCNLNCVNACR